MNSLNDISGAGFTFRTDHGCSSEMRRNLPRFVAPHTNGTPNLYLSMWWASSAGVTPDSSMKSTPRLWMICASTKWPIRLCHHRNRDRRLNSFDHVCRSFDDAPSAISAGTLSAITAPHLHPAFLRSGSNVHDDATREYPGKATLTGKSRSGGSYPQSIYLPAGNGHCYDT